MEKNDFVVSYVDVNEINPAKYNPRKISAHKFRSLKKSVEEHGILNPIIVNKKTGNTIVGGHQRYRVAKELGLSKIPVTFVDLSEDEEKLLNIALNNATGDFDRQKLQRLVENIVVNDAINLEDAGFRREDIDKMINREEEEEFEPEYPIAPYFSEKYNYVVILAKNDVEWTWLKDRCGIRKEQSYKSSYVGEGRAVTVERLQELWNK